MPKKRSSGRNTKTPTILDDYVLNNKNNNQNKAPNSENCNNKDDDVSELEKKIDSEEDKGRNNDENQDMERSMEEGEILTDFKKGDDVAPVVSNSGSPSVVAKSDNTSENKSLNVSYANIVKKQVSEFEKNLFYVPTEVNDKGEEVVIFEEELVLEGCEKWKQTACGFFLGCNMSMNEMRYNLRRMWGKFGLGEILKDSNEICYFKFKNREGMNYVVEQSPWMVNGKPLVVQEWNPDVSIKKTEPNRLPIWVKLSNVSLEAWSLREISTLASRLGKPLMMDSMTASMCHSRKGRAGFARVLIEIEAGKGVLDKIEVVYKDAFKNIKGTKTVFVEYAWKPIVCNHCNVFGHIEDKCSKVVKNKADNITVEIKDVIQGSERDEGGWVQNKRFGQNGRKEQKFYGGKVNKEKTKIEYRKVPKINTANKVDNVGPSAKSINIANKFGVLENEQVENSESGELDFFDKARVDWNVKSGKMPSDEVLKNWSVPMKQYFKKSWQEAIQGKSIEDAESDIDNDIIEDGDDAVKDLMADEMNGGDPHILN